MENIWSTHPVASVIAIWIALEVFGYTLISLGIIRHHLVFGFSWPVRAIRNARRFF